MPKTSKIICEACQFSVIVQGEITWKEADEQSEAHLEQNRSHVLAIKAIWIETEIITPE